MRRDKNEAIKLRKQGKSYTEIARQIGISRSTLSSWFAHGELGIDLYRARKDAVSYPPALRALNELRTQEQSASAEAAKREAHQEYQAQSGDALFMCGLLTYLLDGDKSLRTGQVRMSSGDFKILLIFKRFIETYYPAFAARMRLSIILYAAHEQEKSLNWWAKMLSLERSAIYPPTISGSRPKASRLQYGVASLIISDKFLKIKILKLADLLSQRLILQTANRPM